MAKRFKVSLGMVKKLLGQRTKTGDLRPRHRFSGRKGRLMPRHGAELMQLIAREPDVTLGEMKARLKLDCTVAAIQWAVTKLGLATGAVVPPTGERVGDLHEAPGGRRGVRHRIAVHSCH